MELLKEYLLQAGDRSLIIKENRCEYHADRTLKTNREFKDGMFRLLFSEKKAALELLNALEGTKQEDEEKIEIETLEGAIYNNLLNDLAVQYDRESLSIVEHMSTWSENMPIRELLYLARTYQRILPNEDVHRRARRKLPVPRLYVLYNGIEEKPLESIQRLSDAFVFEEEEHMVELIVKVININYSKGHPILERSPTLKQYAQFVERVRNHMKRDGTNRDEAIRASVRSCVKDGILEDFLRKHGNEVSDMLTAITWEEFVDIRVEEAEEIGEKRAWEKAERKIRELESKAEKEREKAEEKAKAQFVTNLLNKNYSIEQIHELAEVPLDKILEIKAAMEAQ